ncbi:MAG: FprA family A-type flavoprotein [Bacteroidales bacterium]|nr:FprA family A-type flavoprotein [Bacteroidales bacterium]
MITPTIHYIGVDDTDLVLFENQYPVPQGISYNSYLIDDEKIAICDTVDRRRASEWRERLDYALNGRTPSYLIVHHMEPDHSACIQELMEKYPELTLVGSAKAIAMLPQFFYGETFAGRTLAVKEGDILDLGYHKLQFLMAPMIHWPEVIMSYDTTEGVLFSADGFGRFGALCYDQEWLAEGRRYYANIVGKYGPQVQTLLRKAAALPINVIASLHGPILKDDIPHYLHYYNLWSSYTPESQGALVAYASVYGGTARAALEVAEHLRQHGAPEVATIDLCRQDVSEAVGQAFRFSTLVLASVTYDAGLFPAMYDFIHHLQIKGLQNRRVALIENGSWAPIAGKQMAAMIGQMKGMTLVEPVLTIKTALQKADYPRLDAFCQAILNP